MLSGVRYRRVPRFLKVYVSIRQLRKAAKRKRQKRAKLSKFWYRTHTPFAFLLPVGDFAKICIAGRHEIAVLSTHLHSKSEDF